MGWNEEKPDHNRYIRGSKMTKYSDILKFAISCYKDAEKIEYPNDFTISTWWDSNRRNISRDIINFKTCDEAILYAQNSSKVGFDHRRANIRGVIDFKMRDMERLCPWFNFKKAFENGLEESIYSDKKTREIIDGFKFSNIFITHVNIYLRSIYTFDYEFGPKRIIEIGSGYGGLARIFKIMDRSIHYVMIDLAESLFFAQVFIATNFPDAKTIYIKDNNRVNLDEYDFVFVPVQFCHTIAQENFDLVINTGSLQEMTGKAVKFWMNFIQEVINVKMFYSWNYFLVNKQIYCETSYDDSNLICPVLDSFWRVKYFRINPDITTVDASGRNWLEVCVERIPAEERDLKKVKEYAENLFRSAKLHPNGSNDWFQYMWMAIWYSPKKEFLLEMIDGISKFQVGLGAKNNLVARNEYDVVDLQRIVKILLNQNLFNVGNFRQNLKLIIKKFASIFGKRQNNINSFDYSELQYYKNLLVDLN